MSCTLVELVNKLQHKRLSGIQLLNDMKLNNVCADDQDVFATIEQEARKSFVVVSWSLDMIRHQMMCICSEICGAEWRFSSHNNLELLFSRISPRISTPAMVDVPSHDWTHCHKHVFSPSARFFSAVSELLRRSIFEQDIGTNVKAMMPTNIQLDSLALVAPRLCNLFRQAHLRTHFESFDVSTVVAPIFQAEYDRLIGQFYHGEVIESHLVGAAQLAARLCIALTFYSDVTFRYEGLLRDMVLDMHTLESPIGKAWIVVLPAITVVDNLGMEVVLHKALAFNDGSSCRHCSAATSASSVWSSNDISGFGLRRTQSYASQDS